MNTPIDRDSRVDAEAPSVLEQRSRELFDEQVANLDGRTRSRLNQARQAALEASRGSSVPGARWLVPAGSAAAVALVALTTVQWMRNPGVESDTQVIAESVTPATAVDDLEILTSSDSLDMLKDMDFYAWLETQDARSSGEAG